MHDIIIVMLDKFSNLQKMVNLEEKFAKMF